MAQSCGRLRRLIQQVTVVQSTLLFPRLVWLLASTASWRMAVEVGRIPSRNSASGESSCITLSMVLLLHVAGRVARYGMPGA